MHKVYGLKLWELLSILINYNTTENPKIDNMINFISSFRLFFSHHQE